MLHPRQNLKRRLVATELLGIGPQRFIEEIRLMLQMSIFPVNARNRLVSRYFIRDLEVPIFTAKIIQDLAFGKTRAIVADEIKDLTHDVCDAITVRVLHTFFRYNKTRPRAMFRRGDWYA